MAGHDPDAEDPVSDERREFEFWVNGYRTPRHGIVATTEAEARERLRKQLEKNASWKPGIDPEKLASTSPLLRVLPLP
jgi:hypothetical protein